MKTMLVIDGNSILNRAFYGIKLLTNQKGLFTNAIYGMINIISKHIETLSPDYCAVAFDLKAPTFRHKMYDGYKANRKGMPEELAVQLPYAKECMSAMGIHVITREGFEADDLLGTLSKKASDNNIETYILTGDRDSLQLIGDNVSVLLVKTKDTPVFDRDAFTQEYGISPEQFVDVKALMGDSSDNIPGVAGIGEKTALKLISEFSTLDSLYTNYSTSSLSPSLKQKLENGKDMAYLSKTLATIDREVPIEQDIESFQFNGVNNDKLYDLFTELEFFALIKKFALVPSNSENQTLSDDMVEEDLNIIDITASDVDFPYANKSVAVHYENDKLTICDGENISDIIATEHSEIFDKIAKNCRVICYDYKNLVKLFRNFGTDLQNCEFDCLLASYILDSGRNNFSLSDICLRYLGKAPAEKENKAKIIYDLFKKLSELISQDGQDRLLNDIEIPLAYVLADMEMIGFKIDKEGIIKYGEELGECASQLQERIYSYAFEEFNINSTKQLGEVLFEKLNLPVIKKNKTGYSTDAEVLQKLIPYHPIIQDILDYRQVTKLKSTYADGLPKAADENGRVHSIFNQTGTATGRLSSLEPNLQNIPVRTELGRNFRKFFIPVDSEHVLIDADYSQIELRILAHIANDEIMKNSFINGTDIHTATAARVFDVSPENVTSDLRKKAKAVNFGILYGMGEYSLSEDLNITRAQAKKYIESYLNGFPDVSKYLNDIKAQAKDKGYVTTLFGRKRFIPELSSSNKNLQHFGERVAMNSPIQGTAADIIKIAMILVHRELRDRSLDANLILQVHDELLIESNISCAEEVLELLINCMEKAVSLTVPLEVEAKMGKTWYDAK